MRPALWSVRVRDDPVFVTTQIEAPSPRIYLSIPSPVRGLCDEFSTLPRARCRGSAAMPVMTIDDLISSDEEADIAAPPAPTGRLAPGSLAAAHRARKPQRASPVGRPAAQQKAPPPAGRHAAQHNAKAIDYMSSSDETDQSPAPMAGTTHAALRQQARQVAQLRSRLEAPSPSARRFTFQSPPPSPALYLPTLPGEGSSLLQEAGATGQAGLDEATLYDAAGGAALSELMTGLLHAAGPSSARTSSGDAAAEAALQAAVQSLSACQQQQSLRLQRSVASLRSDLRERLLLLEREFVAKAELLAGDLSEAVRAEKAASEDRVARCAADLRASLQGLSRAQETRTVARHSAQPPSSARHLLQSNDPGGPMRELITPRPGAEWRVEHGSRGRAAPPHNSDSPWRQGTRSRLDELDSDSD